MPPKRASSQLTSLQGSTPLSLIALSISFVSFLHSVLMVRPSYLAGKREELRIQKTQTYTTTIIMKYKYYFFSDRILVFQVSWQAKIFLSISRVRFTKTRTRPDRDQAREKRSRPENFSRTRQHLSRRKPVLAKRSRSARSRVPNCQDPSRVCLELVRQIEKTFGGKVRSGVVHKLRNTIMPKFDLLPFCNATMTIQPAF